MFVKVKDVFEGKRCFVKVERCEGCEGKKMCLKVKVRDVCKGKRCL